jgi:hypothetical protein
LILVNFAECGDLEIRKDQEDVVIKGNASCFREGKVEELNVCGVNGGT